MAARLEDLEALVAKLQKERDAALRALAEKSRPSVSSKQSPPVTRLEPLNGSTHNLKDYHVFERRARPPRPSLLGENP